MPSGEVLAVLQVTPGETVADLKLRMQWRAGQLRLLAGDVHLDNETKLDNLGLPAKASLLAVLMPDAWDILLCDMEHASIMAESIDSLKEELVPCIASLMTDRWRRERPVREMLSILYKLSVRLPSRSHKCNDLINLKSALVPYMVKVRAHFKNHNKGGPGFQKGEHQLCAVETWLGAWLPQRHSYSESLQRWVRETFSGSASSIMSVGMDSGAPPVN
eukprot:CAMPEP_0170636944 /NCGR_PEP_ID=MMETSP0224-20130122/38117_1 /TAXON_ID=285029 /ORGANISM="Togula jolla, Strain CCCM 725" /LENGTH=217 /DNA_ID=CAMNT_0010966729 /DNA_START=3 /DNA_END=656 /DNA_ORIENTATION=+